MLESVVTPETRSEEHAAVVSWSLAIEATVWLIGLETVIRFHHAGLYIAGGVGALFMAWVWWLWRRQRANLVQAIAISYIVIACLGALVFMPGVWAQHLTAIGSSAVWWLVGVQRQRPHDYYRGRTMAFTTAVLLWLSWFSLLSASIYLNVKVLWLIAGGGLVTMAAALLVWLESGIEFRRFRWGLLAMYVLGAEIFTATWWLPTSIIVTSVVATTIVALVSQASRHLWKGNWESSRSRRYLLVGLSIIIVILASARWF